jgi:tRNA(Ile)-lysidine synthase
VRAVPPDPLEIQVRETIRRRAMLAGGEQIVAAVSGGPDSTALLAALVALSGEFRLDVHVAHLDHGLRPDSGEDAAAVRRLAERLGRPYHGGAADVRAAAAREHRSIEDAARQARYAFLAAAARAAGASVIATGHTLDDQAETVLMRLLRGSGGRGLSGIPPVRPHDGLRVIRPLIDTPRRDIDAYVARSGLAARDDATNRDLGILRNRVRLVLLPILEGYNPDVRGALARLADVLRDEADALDTLAAPRIAGVLRGTAGTDASVRISLEAFAALPVALQRRALREAVRRAGGNGAPIAFVHIEEARLGVLSGGPGTVWEGSGGIRIYRRPDAIEVTVPHRDGGGSERRSSRA